MSNDLSAVDVDGHACLHPVEEAQEALSGLSPEAVRKILSGNALDVYTQ